jgi:HK97 family phage major capsid protein
MANRIPLAESPLAAGGYLLPVEQGDILTNGILQEAGAIALAGDKRATSATKTQFSIWLGAPTAGPVGEGAAKPVTGAEFGQAVMDVKKFASIVLFTDEMIEDVQGGDLNVLVDSGVRTAINDVIDAHAVGKDNGADIAGVFNSELCGTTATVEYDAALADGLQKAVSAALGILEGNGYADNNGILLGTGFAQVLRDARSTADASMPIYGPGTGRDPVYGLPSFLSTNLNNAAMPPLAGNVVAIVAHRPNLHVRVRKDVTVSTSTDATVNDGTVDRKLFQEDLTAVRYETRLAFMVHDINRAVVAITNAV